MPATGKHAFDRLCAELDTRHRLAPPAQYLSIQSDKRLTDSKIALPTATGSDARDNALAKCLNGLF